MKDVSASSNVEELWPIYKVNKQVWEKANMHICHNSIVFSFHRKNIKKSMNLKKIVNASRYSKRMWNELLNIMKNLNVVRLAIRWESISLQIRSQKKTDFVVWLPSQNYQTLIQTTEKKHCEKSTTPKHKTAPKILHRICWLSNCF